MVTGGFSSPIAISGNASGFISSLAGTVSAAKDGSETPSTAVASAKAAVVWQNSRRGICNGSIWGWNDSLNGHWLAGQQNCGNAGPPCQAGPRPQFRLIAAP